MSSLENIQVVFDVVANTSPFVKQMRAAQAQVKSLEYHAGRVGVANSANVLNQLQKEISRTMTQGGLFHEQTVTLDDATRKWSKSLQDQKLSIGESYKAMRQYRNEQGMIARAARENLRMSQSIAFTTGINAKGERSMSIFTPSIADMDAAGAKMKYLEGRYLAQTAVMRNFSKEVINMGKNVQWTGRQISVGLTTPIVIFGATAAATFKKVDEELVRISKVYGDSSMNIDQAEVRKKALENAKMIAHEYGVAVEETLALTGDIAATGQVGDNLYNAVRETTRMAQLGEIDKEQSMKATLSLQSAFGLDKQGLVDSVNFLNAVENATSASLDDLTEAIPRAGSVVKALGGDVKDLALYMVAMREGGINAGEGANALKSGLASIITPSKEANNYVQSLGINLEKIVQDNKGDLTGILMEFQKAWQELDKIDQQKVIAKLFGKYQSARMTALFNNLGAKNSQTNKVLEMMKEDEQTFADSAAAELKKSQESISGQFKRAWASLKAELIDVGEVFLSLATKLLKAVSSIMEAFNRAPDWFKQLVSGGLIAGAVVGPMIMAYGIFANLFGNIFGAITRMREQMGGMRFGYRGRHELMTESQAAEQLADKMTVAGKKSEEAMNRVTAAVNRLGASLEALRGLPSTGAFGAAGNTTGQSWEEFRKTQPGQELKDNFTFSLDTQTYNQKILRDKTPTYHYRKALTNPDDTSRKALAQKFALNDILYEVAGKPDAPMGKKEVVDVFKKNIDYSYVDDNGMSQTHTLQGSQMHDNIYEAMKSGDSKRIDAMIGALQAEIGKSIRLGDGTQGVLEEYNKAYAKYKTRFDSLASAISGDDIVASKRAEDEFNKMLNESYRRSAASAVNLNPQAGNRQGTTIRNGTAIATAMNLGLTGGDIALLVDEKGNAISGISDSRVIEEVTNSGQSATRDGAQSSHFFPQAYAQAYLTWLGENQDEMVKAHKQTVTELANQQGYLQKIDEDIASKQREIAKASLEGNNQKLSILQDEADSLKNQRVAVQDQINVLDAEARNQKASMEELSRLSKAKAETDAAAAQNELERARVEEKRSRRRNMVRNGMVGAGGVALMGGMAMSMMGQDGPMANILMGAGSMGMMGAMLGPIGAGVGAALGAIIPASMMLKDAMEKNARAQAQAYMASSTAAEFFGVSLAKADKAGIQALTEGSKEAGTQAEELAERFKSVKEGPDREFIDSLKGLDADELVSTMRDQYASLIQQGMKPDDAKTTVAAQLMAANLSTMASEVMTAISSIKNQEDAINEAMISLKTMREVYTVEASYQPSAVQSNDGRYGLEYDYIPEQKLSRFSDPKEAAGILQNTMGIKPEDFAKLDFSGFGEDIMVLANALREVGQEGTAMTIETIAEKFGEMSGKTLTANQAVKVLNLSLNGIQPDLDLLKATGNIDIVIDVAIREHRIQQRITEIADRARKKLNVAANAMSDDISNATQEASEDNLEALEDASEKRLEALEDEANKRQELLQDQIKDTQEYYDKEIKALQKSNDAKQRAFDAEDRRNNRAKEMRSMEIDYMRAMAEGRFYDAAAIQNDMSATANQYSIEDRRRREEEKTQKKIEALQEARDKKLDGLNKRLEKQREIDQKMLESAREAERDKLDAAREAEQKRVDAVQKANQKIQLDTEKMVKRLGKAYEKGPKEFKALTQKYGISAKEGMALIVSEAGFTGSKARKMIAQGLAGGNWKLVSKAIGYGLEGKQEKADEALKDFIEDIANRNFTKRGAEPLDLQLRHQGLATGGYVSGPGSANSDSIPARLSNGEFVVRARAVQKIGVSRLNHMNQRGEVPAFAEGGLVGDVASSVTRTVMWDYIQQKIDSRVKKIKEVLDSGEGTAGLGITGKLGETNSVTPYKTNNNGRVYYPSGNAHSVGWSGTPNWGVNDIGSAGMPIFAYARGVVLHAGPFANGSYSPGSTIDIKHANGGKTRYAHLSRVNVKPNDYVAAGKRIGTSGSDHLHFEWTGMPSLTQRERGGLVPWLAKGGLISDEGMNGKVINLPTGIVSGISGTQLKELVKAYAKISSTAAVQAVTETKETKRSAGLVEGMGNDKSPEMAQKFARALMMRKYGWGQDEFKMLKELWTRESGWRWDADNPTSDAYGIPQALPGSKMGPGWRTDPEAQIRWGLRYIKERYTTPTKAMDFWNSHNWYKNGGLVIPQLRKGATINYDNTLANLHKGETVLTAPLTQKLRDNVSGIASGGDIVYNVSIKIDKASATAKQIDESVYGALDRHSSRVGRRRGF